MLSHHIATWHDETTDSAGYIILCLINAVVLYTVKTNKY